MIKIGVVTGFLALSFGLFGQHTYYAVKLKDKKCSQIASPEQFLSPKTLERRTRHQIPITSQDFPICTEYIQQIVSLPGVTLKNKLKWTNEITVITDESGKSEIEKFGFVQSVNFICKVPKKHTGQSRKLENDSSFIPGYGQGWAQVGMIGINSLHKDGYTGKGLTIGVFDAGFRHMDTMGVFQSLWVNGQITGFMDFVNGKDSVFYNSNHGMNVLSTMGVNANNELVGTAPFANYWLMLTEDSKSESLIEEYNWAEAAEMADSLGIDIINSSLGYTEFDDPSTNHTYEDMDGNTTPITKAANTAFEKGILVVNSAGNSGGNSWYYIGAPADGYGVLSVGAVGENQEVAPFSSRGPNSAGQVKPEVCAMGWQTAIVGSNGLIGRGNGTSFSGPVISGAAACLWQAYPEMSNKVIREAIIESAHRFQNPDENYGYGIPNFQKALELLEKRRFPETDNQDLYASFLLFPNPAREQSRIEFIAGTNNQKVQVRIYDMVGRTVYERDYLSTIGHNYIEIPSYQFKAGVYVVELNIAGSRSSKRLIIQRKKK